MNSNSTPKRTGMTTHHIAIGISALLIVTALAQPSLGQQAADKARERIGIYDARAVAVAYAGSAFQEQKLNDLKEQFRRAREAGEATKVSRLEAEGQAVQAQLHRQGFGTAAVEDLLTHIATDIPAIQETSGVTCLISKWNAPELGKHPKAERVDVTMQLVDAFHPNELQRKRAIEIQKKPPVRTKN